MCIQTETSKGDVLEKELLQTKDEGLIAAGQVRQAQGLIEVNTSN